MFLKGWMMFWIFLLNVAFLLYPVIPSAAHDEITIRRPRLRSIQFVDDNHAWMAGYRGVYYTSDGGQTWQRQSVPVRALYGRLKSPMDVHKGIIVSADQHQAIIRGEEGLILVRPNSRQIQQRPIPREFRPYMTAIRFSDQKHGWGAGTVGQVYRTVDGGITWNLRSEPVSTRLNAIAVLPHQLWIVGDEGTVLHTSDDGKSWDNQALPQKDGNITDLASVFFLDPQEGWIGGLDGLLFHTKDGGRHWEKQDTPVSKGAEIFAISFCSNIEGWAVGSEYINNTYKPLLFHTKNGGRIWQLQVFNPEVPLTDVQALSNGRAWAIGWDGSIFRTIDYGQTWAAVTIY
jgi:photosystem II stability/assembly factor-like uncharacterized protein